LAPNLTYHWKDFYTPCVAGTPLIPAQNLDFFGPNDFYFVSVSVHRVLHVLKRMIADRRNILNATGNLRKILQFNLN